MGKKRKLVIIAYLFAVLTLLVVIYFVPSVTGALTRTEILEYGSLQIFDEAACFFVRNETVYLANASGTINYYLEQDTQVKGGTTILDITRSDYSVEKSVYATIVGELGASAVQPSVYASEGSGIVSYYVDGYEATFTPEKVMSISHSDVRGMQVQAENLVREATMKGEPIYKICDNSTWYVTCWVDAGSIAKYEIGKDVTLQLPMGEVKATIKEMENEGDVWQVLFETNRYYEEFSYVRKAEATIVTSDYSGIIVPNKSITSQDGQIGVFVKSKSGDFNFKPIDVIGSDGSSSVVTPSYYYDSEGKRVSTVNTYDEILKNPN